MTLKIEIFEYSNAYYNSIMDYEDDVNGAISHINRNQLVKIEMNNNKDIFVVWNEDTKVEI